jgi:hypothetical protein
VFVSSDLFLSFCLYILIQLSFSVSCSPSKYYALFLVDRSYFLLACDKNVLYPISDNGYACSKLTLNYAEELYLLGYNAV